MNLIEQFFFRNFWIFLLLNVIKILYLIFTNLLYLEKHHYNHHLLFADLKSIKFDIHFKKLYFLFIISFLFLFLFPSHISIIIFIFFEIIFIGRLLYSIYIGYKLPVFSIKNFLIFISLILIIFLPPAIVIHNIGLNTLFSFMYLYFGSIVAVVFTPILFQIVSRIVIFTYNNFVLFKLRVLSKKIKQKNISITCILGTTGIYELDYFINNIIEENKLKKIKYYSSYCKVLSLKNTNNIDGIIINISIFDKKIFDKVLNIFRPDYITISGLDKIYTGIKYPLNGILDYIARNKAKKIIVRDNINIDHKNVTKKQSYEDIAKQLLILLLGINKKLKINKPDDIGNIISTQRKVYIINHTRYSDKFTLFSKLEIENISKYRRVYIVMNKLYYLGRKEEAFYSKFIEKADGIIDVIIVSDISLYKYLQIGKIKSKSNIFIIYENKNITDVLYYRIKKDDLVIFEGEFDRKQLSNFINKLNIKSER